MLRKKFSRKMLTGAILMVFWSIILVSQAANLRIQNAKFGKTTFGKQSTTDHGRSTTNDTQPNPVSAEEEEEDGDFKLEPVFFQTDQHEQLVVRNYGLQEEGARDPHREILSPPPQL